GLGALLDPAAPASRFARTIAGAAENARKDIRLPIDHVGVVITLCCNQSYVFGDRSVGGTGPLTIDDFVKIVGIGDIRRFQNIFLQRMLTQALERHPQRMLTQALVSL